MAMTRSAAAAATLLLALAACQAGAPAAGDAGAGRQPPASSATATPAAKQTMATTVATAAADFAPVRSLEFARAVFRLSEGENVAISRGGSFSFSCLLNEQSMQGWNPPRMQPAPLDIERAFVGSLTAAGYKVAGGSDELFGRSRGASGDLLAGAIVTDVDMALCRRYSFLHKKVLGYIGDATITVEWQVLSRASDSVVLKTTTTASASVEEEDVSPAGVPLLLTRAFAAAADPRLRELAGAGPTHAATTPSGPDGRFDVRGVTLRTRSFASDPAEIAGSTFVVALGNGHGSGFLISRDGYALTNSHVVRGLAQVSIVLADGRQATADVLREDPRRDVALLKLPPQAAGGLAVRCEPVRVTEEVFAIGAPAGSANAQSVTRGIVGSRRVDAATGLAFLQSDAAILPGSSGGPLVDRHGNVVGIAVARLGVRDRGAATPLNYFVPIDEALEALNIDLK